MITLLHAQNATEWPDATVEGDQLWLDADQVRQATGWAWKPEGLCQGDVCVPVPPAQRSTLVRGDRIDLAGLWRHSGQPVVHDAARRTWVLGTGAAQRADALASLQAPDFTLPDLEGRPHRLSDLRGRKVFLATWASW